MGGGSLRTEGVPHADRSFLVRAHPVTLFGLEWPLDRKVEQFAQTYNVLGGLSVLLGDVSKGKRQSRASRT